MNDWSDYALARLKKQDDDRRLKDERFLATQKILKTHGLALWHEVRRIVGENVTSLNAKAEREILAVQVTQDTVLRVRNMDNPDRDILRATFDGEIGKLEWDCGHKKGMWELTVSDDGKIRFHWGMVPTTPDSIAKQILDALLFG